MPYALHESTIVNIIAVVAFTSRGEISDPTSNSWHDISITVQSLLHLPDTSEVQSLPVVQTEEIP